MQLDEEGYLVDPADWNEQVAEALAREERIVLSDEHWAVIRFMREYYEQRHIAPDARQACKIAGMRRPRAWSTG
jgi:tRNA 2-thiouridine synthesizing protein E